MVQSNNVSGGKNCIWRAQQNSAAWKKVVVCKNGELVLDYYKEIKLR